jgi:hypothetical protein
MARRDAGVAAASARGGEEASGGLGNKHGALP